MLEKSSPFSDFIQTVRTIVTDSDDHEIITDQVKQALLPLIRSRFLANSFTRTSLDGYTRNVLHHDELGFQVLAIAWAPGQSTPIHDHADTWGVVGVYSGCIEIVDYVPISEVGDRSRMTARPPQLAEENEAAYVVTRNERHAVRNPSCRDAVTIHLYGKAVDGAVTWTPTNDDWYMKTATPLTSANTD